MDEVYAPNMQRSEKQSSLQVQLFTAYGVPPFVHADLLYRLSRFEFIADWFQLLTLCASRLRRNQMANSL
jgi:hypothetical protein